MKHLQLLLAASGLAMACTAAHATDRDSRRVFEGYAQCVVERHPRDSSDVVLSTGPSKDVLRRHPDLVIPDCLPGQQLKMPGADFLRYGLAEALVRREYAKGLPADIGRATPLAHFEVDESEYRPKPGKTLKPKRLAELQEDRAKAVAIRTVSIYAECVARTNPAAALRLVLSDPATSEEAQAFGALHVALATCLPEGETITLDKTNIRGAIAMNLYRLAKAPRAPVPVAVAK